MDKRRQASQKEHVLSLKRLCQLKLSTRSFAGLIPDSRNFNFPSTFACSFIAVFSFLVRFFRFFELVHGHFHGLGLFIPKIITPADQYLEQSSSVKYLGIIIDCFLSWHEHIYHISGKISKSVNIIAKLKSHVTSQSLISIYYALVYPYLTYGCVLWGNNYEGPLSQLVRLQNKVVRIMNDVPLRDHITPHYVNLGLIKLPDIVKLYTCQLFYDHLIDNKPSNLNLSLVSEQHNYATRSASLQHLNPESFRINIRQFCPTILGCYYWNDFPLSIRNQPTRKLFKKALHQYYFAQY